MNSRETATRWLALVEQEMTAAACQIAAEMATVDADQQAALEKALSILDKVLLPPPQSRELRKRLVDQLSAEDAPLKSVRMNELEREIRNRKDELESLLASSDEKRHLELRLAELSQLRRDLHEEIASLTHQLNTIREP